MVRTRMPGGVGGGSREASPYPDSPMARYNTLCIGKGISMVAVKEFSWEEVSAPDFTTPARRAWREAVAAIAAKAKAALPETSNGRLEKAVAIVLTGDVELLPDGKAKVASQSNDTTQYVVCNGTCECGDFARVEGGWCPHRTAAAIHKRASALAKQKLAQLDGTSTGQAEAPRQPAQPAAS